MKKVMLVFGTRPDAIKMCPLVNELKKRQDITTVVCISGQHREMLREVLEIFDVHPDYNLDIMRRNQTLGNITTDVLKGIENILTRERPDIVLVHGDTTTAFSAALACFGLFRCPEFFALLYRSSSSSSKRGSILRIIFACASAVTYESDASFSSPDLHIPRSISIRLTKSECLASPR